MPGTSRPTRRRPLPHAVEEREAPSAEVRAAQAEKAAAEERTVLIRRLRTLAVLFAFFILVVLAQLLLTQVLNLAQRPQRVVAQTEDTSRGRIVDRNGILFATDGFIWEMYLDPSRYDPDIFKPDMVAQAAQELELDTDVIMEAISQPGSFALVAKDVTRQQCLAANDGKTVPDWIWCAGKRKRTYPQGYLAAHVIGFANQDQIGQAGLEAYYNDWLRGAGEWDLTQLAGTGESIPHEWELFLPSANGRDLVLNLSRAPATSGRASPRQRFGRVRRIIGHYHHHGPAVGRDSRHGKLADIRSEQLRRCGAKHLAESGRQPAVRTRISVQNCHLCCGT